MSSKFPRTDPLIPDDLVIHSSFLQQVEAPLPPPACPVKQSNWKRTAVFNVVEGRSSPDSSLTVDDYIVSRHVLGRMQGDVEFPGCERGRELHA